MFVLLLMSKVLFIIKSATNVELKYFKYLFLPFFPIFFLTFHLEIFC